jgi:hypothetical protein
MAKICLTIDDELNRKFRIKMAEESLGRGFMKQLFEDAVGDWLDKKKR